MSSAAAAIVHNQNSEELLRRVGELAENSSAHLHSHHGPELDGWVAKHPFAHAHPPLSAE